MYERSLSAQLAHLLLEKNTLITRELGHYLRIDFVNQIKEQVVASHFSGKAG